LLGYDSNSHAYYVFNKVSDCVETTCDVVFDKTNVSQEEQVDLDLVDDEEVPYDALQRKIIGDIRPQDSSEQSEGSSLSDTTPPTQGLDKYHEENQNEHEDEHND
jgi:hypothetical protein